MVAPFSLNLKGAGKSQLPLVNATTANAEHNGGTPKPRQCAVVIPSACCDLLHLHSDLI